MHQPQPAPMMERRPDGRMEVRHGDVVLLESVDRWTRRACWPIVRVEAYLIDPADGIEMWQGYLNEPTTPRRLEYLRLWAAAGVNLLEAERERARAPLSDRHRRALQFALWDAQVGGQVLRSPLFDWRRRGAARRCA